MSGLLVGRAIPVNAMHAVGTARLNGDKVTISGSLKEPSGLLADDLVARLADYQDSTDEVCMPVVWPEGPAWVSGFYRCDSSQSTGRAVVTPMGVYDFDLDLTRVQGFAAPLFESVLLGSKRADTTTAQAFHALPASAKGYETGVLTPFFDTIASQTGSVLVFRDATNVFFNARSQYYVRPEDWYVGAATMSMNSQVVVGHQIPNKPDQWMVSNGIVRLVAKPGGWFTTERWNGTAWVTPGEWTPGIRATGGSGTFTALEAPHTVTVMKNTPQSVIIRLTTDVATAVAGERYAATVDIELRRGATIADINVSARGSKLWGVRTPLDFASKTDYTNGFGQGGFLVGARSTSGAFGIGGKVIVSGGVNSSSVNVGVGYPFIGASAAQDALFMWCAVQSENVIVAAR